MLQEMFYEVLGVSYSHQFKKKKKKSGLPGKRAYFFPQSLFLDVDLHLDIV